MKRTTYVLLTLMLALSVVFPATVSADWTTTGLFIDSPEAGERFGTHDLIRIRWHAWVDWGVWDDPPAPETIHYTVWLNGALLAQGHYDEMDVHFLWGEVTGSVDYRVPGNGASRNPNSALTVCMDRCPFSPCQPDDNFCSTVTIGVKTWYDPLPHPQQTSPAMDKDQTATATTWGRIKALYE